MRYAVGKYTTIQAGEGLGSRRFHTVTPSGNRQFSLKCEKKCGIGNFFRDIHKIEFFVV